MKVSILRGLAVTTAAVMIIAATSCDPAAKYEREERNSIDSYIQEHMDTPFELKASGLYYHEVTAGTGVQATQHDTAYVMYTGKFLDGTVFDSNIAKKDTLIFPIDEGYMIPGFDEAITYMRAKGKALVLMPSSLAYGPTGYYTISGYTPLLFEIELARVKTHAK